MEKNKIKGWECYPIVIEGTDLNYFILNIIGRAGLICEYDEEGDVKYGSINVDYNSWDGSDIFLLGQGGIKVINNKLKMIIEQAKITNLEFEEINKY